MACCVSTKQKHSNPVVVSDPPHVIGTTHPLPLTVAQATEEAVKEVVLSEIPISTPHLKNSHSFTNSLKCSTQMDNRQDPVGSNPSIMQRRWGRDESVNGSESTEWSTATRSSIARTRNEARKEVVIEEIQRPIAPMAKRVCSGDVQGSKDVAIRVAPGRPTMLMQQRRVEHGGGVPQCATNRSLGKGETVSLEMKSAVSVRKRVPVVGQSRDVAVDVSGSGAARQAGGGGLMPEMTESFENPLVSLECFIFL